MTPPTSPIERTGLYTRQSKDKSKSLAEQVAECTGDILAQGWTVGERYSDGVSASRFSRKARPDWDRLLTDLDAGKLDVLVLWESSRGDRDAETWLGLLRRCRERRVLIRVTSHERTYDPARARDWKALAEDGLDSHYESEKTSLRLRRATAAAAAAGLPHGKVTYGYVRRYDPVTKKLVEQVPHPDQAAIVVEITNRVGHGHPLVTIVDDLNAREVPAPAGGIWTRKTVKSIATSPTYRGKRVHAGETYDAIWPPLVDELAHLAARRVLEDPRRKTTRPGRQKWLLSYLARCGVCDGPVTRIPMRDSLTRPDRYQCGRGCTGIQAAGLDEFISEMVCRRLAAPDGIDLSHADDADVLAARTEATELQARLDAWRDSGARGETSPASLARIEADLIVQIRAAQRREVSATTPPALVRLLDGAAQVLDDDERYEEIRRRFDAEPVAVRREVITFLAVVRVARAKQSGLHGFDPLRLASSQWVGDEKTWGDHWAG